MIAKLIDRQNADGGWPYVRGRSWTEPTVYAVLALSANGETERARKGIRWLAGLRRADGGWPVQPEVQDSAWVTALVALLPAEELGADLHEGAVRWLLGTTGQESGRIYRIRQRLLGNKLPPEQEHPGWPWVPGAAAWVGPTSLAILALEKEQRRKPNAAAADRVAEGRRFLFSRMCREGGWNHGSVRALGYESLPYPETTGMALAALRGIQSPQVETSLNAGVKFLNECRSADALNWLQLGLLAHGRLPAGFVSSAEIAYRTVPEASLHLLAAAAAGGRTWLWS